MPRFDKSKIEELKNYLYYSNIHDAKIEKLRFDRERRNLDIEVVNPIHNVRINLTFNEVKVFLCINGNIPGCRETIISLTTEDDYTSFKNFTKICGDCFEDSLYLLFQLFSGDELHIVAKEVLIRTIRGRFSD